MDDQILILSFSPLHRDPRVQRQIMFLQNRFKLKAAGLTDPGLDGVDFINLPSMHSGIFYKALQGIRLKAKRFESYYWNIDQISKSRQLLKNSEWRLILANDLLALPLALDLADGHKTKVLVDAHEYEPLHFDDNWMFNFFFKSFWDYIAREYLPQADAMTTVCRGIALAYRENYGVSCEVISNAVHYHELSPSPTETEVIRMVHHGICNRSRRLENMIELMDCLDERFRLDLILVPSDGGYLRKLKSMLKNKPRVRLLEPVQYKQIVPVLHRYDLGLFLLWPQAFNYRMALPNKFFEYIQARLGVVIWPSPEMAEIVRTHGIGSVADDFSISSAASALNRLNSEDVDLFKKKAGLAARKLCAENNQDILLNLVSELME